MFIGITDSLPAGGATGGIISHETIREHCRQGPNQPDWYSFLETKQWRTRHLFLEPRSGIVYCDVPKAGSTSWLKTLSAMASAGRSACAHERGTINIHKTDFWRQCGLKQMVTLDKVTLESLKFDSYFKFMFVRNPYSRLLSAYMWRFGHRRHTGRRPRHNFTFERFLKMVMYQNTYDRKHDQSNSITDLHWMPATLICLPCGISYNVTGKLEHAHQASKHILKMVKVNMTYSQLNIVSSRKGAPGMEAYYKDIKPAILRGINDVFADDFRIFGYQTCTDLDCILNTTERH